MPQVTLSKEAKEAQKAYRKKWREEHPEKVREYEARYWEKRAKQAIEAEREATEHEHC